MSLFRCDGASVPSWGKKPLGELPSTFNARAEIVAEKRREPMLESRRGGLTRVQTHKSLGSLIWL